MSNYLKLFKSEFEKYAQGLDMPPSRPSRAGGAGASPTPKAKPAPTGDAGAAPTGGGKGGLNPPSRHPRPAQTGAAGPSNAGIKDLQRKLMKLSEVVLSQMNLADIAKTQQPVDTSPGLHPITPGNEPQPTREATEAGGRGSFGDFLARRTRQSPVPGVEFDPNPNKKQMSEKSPSDPTRLSVMMDTMSRVGNPKQGEKFDDGSWGPRTNAALHNAYAFAYTLLKLAKDFDLQVKSYSESDLQGFKVPDKETDMPILDRIATAPILAKHIEAIIRLFNEIKAGILENPQYQTYIENDTPYATYGKAKPAGPPGSPQAQQQQPAMLSAQEANEIYKAYPQFNISFTGQDGQVQQRPMTITNLLNLQALEAWKKASGVTLSVPEITKQIWNQVSVAPREYTPKQDEAWQAKKWEEEQAKAKAIRKGK
jgi:hypothetical protein